MSFFDDFNRADSTTVGNGWTDAAGAWEIINNSLDINTDTGGFVDQLCVAPAAADFTDGSATVQFTTNTFQAFPQIHIRLDDTAFNGYLIYCTSSQLVLARLTSSGLTTLDTASISLTINTDYELRLEAVSDSIIGHIKASGAVVDLGLVSATDSTYTTGKTALGADRKGVVYEDFNSIGSALPLITSVDSDNIVAQNQTNVQIVGGSFEATQGIGTVMISPTDDINDVNDTAQVVTSWSNTSIEFTANFPPSVLPGQIGYLFVTNNTSTSNLSGFQITREVIPAFIITSVLKNYSGSVLSNQTGLIANIYSKSTGELIVRKTSQTTDASGVMTITDTLIVTGQDYFVRIEDGVNLYGTKEYLAT